jgi:hypothetical protein
MDGGVAQDGGSVKAGIGSPIPGAWAAAFVAAVNPASITAMPTRATRACAIALKVPLKES